MEVISVPTVAVTRASASVRLEALCLAAPPSGLPGVPARGHAASVLLLRGTGSFLSHRAAPILELQLRISPARTPEDQKDNDDFLLGREGVEQGTWEHEDGHHPASSPAPAQAQRLSAGVLGPSLCVLMPMPGNGSSEMLCQEFLCAA